MTDKKKFIFSNLLSLVLGIVIGAGSFGIASNINKPAKVSEQAIILPDYGGAVIGEARENGVQMMKAAIPVEEYELVVIFCECGICMGERQERCRLRYRVGERNDEQCSRAYVYESVRRTNSFNGYVGRRFREVGGLHGRLRAKGNERNPFVRFAYG